MTFIPKFASREFKQRKKMRRTIVLLFTVSVIAMLMSGCGKHDTSTTERTVKVKFLEVGCSTGDGKQGYSGTIEEMSGTALSFASGGTITHIYVNEGQSVSRGQLVATVDARNVTNSATASRAMTSQADDLVAQAQAALAQAQDAYNRMKILHDNGSLPEIKWIEVETQLEQAKLAVSQAQSNARAARATQDIASKSVSDTRLVAPVSGYVSAKSADVGQNVLPGAPVVKIVQIDRVKVNISVPEREISNIAKGQKIAVTVASLNGRRYEATVVEKGVTADPLSRSYNVKAVINNPNRELLPGMIAEVYMGTNVASYPSLPAAIIQIDADNKPFVWTVADGKAVKTYVALGRNVGDEVQIIGGIKVGDKVICEGQQKVSNGMNVKE